MKTIKITIDKVGKVSMDVQGVTGQSCKDLTKPFENALSSGNPSDVVSVDKPELYMEETTGMSEYN